MGAVVTASVGISMTVLICIVSVGSNKSNVSWRGSSKKSLTHVPFAVILMILDEEMGVPLWESFTTSTTACESVMFLRCSKENFVALLKMVVAGCARCCTA